MPQSKRAQIRAWTSATEMAEQALTHACPGTARLRGRLESTAFSLHEAIHTVRRMEDELETVRAELRRLLQWTLDFIDRLPMPYVMTASNGRILEATTAAADALNLSRRGLIGRNLLLFLDDRLVWFDLLSSVIRSGQAVRRHAMLRPRERLARAVTVTVCLSSERTIGDVALLWFIAGPPDASTEQASEDAECHDLVRASPPGD